MTTRATSVCVGKAQSGHLDEVEPEEKGGRISTQKEAQELHTSRKKRNWQRQALSPSVQVYGMSETDGWMQELRKLGLNARRLGTLTGFFNLMTVRFKKD